MSEITKRAQLRAKSLVEFELDGRTVNGWLVKLEGGNAVVRCGSERLLTFLYWEVLMVETEVIVLIWGQPGDDDQFVWEGCEDEEYYSYYGTRVDRCFWCWVDVNPADTVIKRRLDNWEVPVCVTCVDPDQRPCQGCHQGQGVCICVDIDDGRSY